MARRACASAPRAWAQSGLVAAYSFNEGSGNSVDDASSSSNDGTIKDAAWTTSGRYGAALVFNGSSAVVNIASSRSLRLTTAMTLEAWVRPAKVSTWWSDVIYKGNDNYYLMGASDNSSRPAAGGKFASTTSSNVFGPSALAADTWTHLAATYDGSTLKLYINGALASSGTRSGSMATSNNPLQIGGDSTFGQHFAGIIDEVKSLLGRGLPETAKPFGGLVYRQVLEHLHGVRDEAATRELIVRENRRYARRQLIWFRKEPNLRWFDGPGEAPELQASVLRWLADRGHLLDGGPAAHA